MTVLLDSTLLIEALRPQCPRRAQIRELFASDEELATAAISVAEVYAGARDRERAKTTPLIDSLFCYEITREIARYAGEMKRSGQDRGVVLHLPDLLIAAVALHHNLRLLTDNRKDFPMENLVFYPFPKPEKPGANP